jgi:hypothetical protein
MGDKPLIEAAYVDATEKRTNDKEGEKGKR